MKLITKPVEFKFHPAIPSTIIELLTAKKAFLAGGYPLSAMVRSAVSTDIDLFTSFRELDFVLGTLKQDGYVLEARSRFAYTFRGMTGLPIQVIPVEGLDLKGSVLPLLLTFDLQISQVAYNAITDQIEMTPGAELGIETGIVELGKVRFPKLVMQRLLKYQKKGFNVSYAADRLIMEAGKIGYSTMKSDDYDLKVDAVSTLEIKKSFQVSNEFDLVF